jgi:hypothetical protein
MEVVMQKLLISLFSAVLIFSLVSLATAQSPGETVGTTQYDYQSNGTIGNKIVVDGDGTVHITWMNGISYPGTRQVYFNCKSNGVWLSPGNGVRVGYKNGDGYPSIAAMSDGRAVVAYHNAASGAESLFVAIDAFSCLGQFDYYHPPSRLSGLFSTWPNIAVQANGNIQLTATTNSQSIVMYTRSTNGGVNWTAAATVDTSGSISQMITTSPVSNKVAIIYTRENIDAQVDTTSDIYYVQSNDGLVWDFRNNRVNVTNYGPDHDSISAGSDIDAVYDYNDNLHILWNAHWATTTYYYYLSWLYHYSSATGVITEIAKSDSLWPSAGCDFGGWNWHYCKMSMGAKADGGLVITYTDFDTSDCSECGYANGDIYGQYSGDGGATWHQRVNVTNSQTPGCINGDCDSDNWSSLAEKVDDNGHLFYVNDKDAGGIPQTECVVSDNNVMYYAFPVTLLGVEEPTPVPLTFSLDQNYPNPFNARTTIRFSLEKRGNVKLEIYDILGSRVASVLDETREAGSYAVNWNANGMASGVYYYKLTTKDGAISKQMVLVK